MDNWFQAEAEITGAQESNSKSRRNQHIEAVALTAIKFSHTVIWAFLAGCILALPIAGFRHRFDWAIVLSAITLVECGALALNRGRCPLTDLAARFSDEQTDNFDIYLPNWLARYNKAIFGTIFVMNELIVLWLWLK
jgi:hypothetical protein